MESRGYKRQDKGDTNGKVKGYKRQGKGDTNGKIFHVFHVPETITIPIFWRFGHVGVTRNITFCFNHKCITYITYMKKLILKTCMLCL